MKFPLLYSLILLLFVSCAMVPSLQKPSAQQESFEKGLQLMFGDEAYQAKKLWQLVCGEGHQLSCWASGKTVSTKAGLAIMQGATDDISTQLAVLAKKNSNLGVYLRDTKTGRLLKETKRREAARKYSEFAVIQIQYQGLEPGITYELAIADASGEILDLRELQTLKASGKELSFALTSCMDDSYVEEQKSQWLDLMTFKPEVLFMIGDNVYVDIRKKRWLRKISPETIWQRYVETRNNLQIFRVKRLVPVFATWDDHDFGRDVAGGDFEYKDASKAIFNEFFPQELNKVVINKGPGISQIVRMREQTFVFLDDRSFRSNHEKKQKPESHFGEDQEKWLLQWLKKLKGPAWIISGDQFFGGYHPFDSYQANHPIAFEKFLKTLRQSKRRYVFVSGDRHLTELMKIPVRATGFQTYELTSSPIHAMVFPGSFKKHPNPLGIEGKDGMMNYMLVDSKSLGRGVQFKTRSYGLNKKLLFKRELKVQ